MKPPARSPRARSRARPVTSNSTPTNLRGHPLRYITMICVPARHQATETPAVGNRRASASSTSGVAPLAASRPCGRPSAPLAEQYPPFWVACSAWAIIMRAAQIGEFWRAGGGGQGCMLWPCGGGVSWPGHRPVPIRWFRPGCRHVAARGAASVLHAGAAGLRRPARGAAGTRSGRWCSAARRRPTGPRRRGRPDQAGAARPCARSPRHPRACPQRYRARRHW